MRAFGIDNTQLIIRQDSLDLRSTILSEIDKRNVSVSEKDLTIRALNNTLSSYQLADPELDKDIKIIFQRCPHTALGDSNFMQKKTAWSTTSPSSIRLLNHWKRSNAISSAHG